MTSSIFLLNPIIIINKTQQGLGKLMHAFENAIIRYLSLTNPDYAIMLNGSWGIGKTWYIKNNLNYNGKKLTYISLANITSSEEVKSLIIAETIEECLITTNTNLHKISRKASKSDDLKTGVIGYFASSVFDQIFIRHISPKLGAECPQRFFVFDDIERFNVDLQILFATIHDLIIEKGAHVMYIAYEEMIDKNKNYKKIKEKYIRYTYTYSIINNETLKSIARKVAKDNSNFKHLMDYDENLNLLTSWMFDTGITNLRTFMTAIECYEYLQTIFKTEGNKYRLYLFLTCLFHADFFKTQENSNTTFFEHAKKRNIVPLPQDLGRYTDKNNSISECSFISEFYQNGYISNEERAKAILSTQYTEGDEFQQAFHKFSPLLEDDELFETAEYLIDAINKKKLEYSNVKDLSIKFSRTESIYGSAFFRLDYKTPIISALKNDSYPGKKSYLLREYNEMDMIRIIKDNNHFIENVRTIINEEREKLTSIEEKEKLISLIQNEDNSIKSIHMYNPADLFSGIVKYDLLDLIGTLDKEMLCIIIDMQMDRIENLSEELINSLQIIQTWMINHLKNNMNLSHGMKIYYGKLIKKLNVKCNVTTI